VEGLPSHLRGADSTPVGPSGLAPGAILNDDIGIDGIRAAGETLERAGFGSVWVGETYGFDLVTQASLVAAATTGVQVGVVWNIFTRPPALAAMTLASMAALTEGRLVVALGASSRLIVEQWNQLPFHRPVDRMLEVIEGLRTCFAGERMDGGFRLKVPPAVPPEVVVATTGPRMLAAVTPLVDGVMVNWCTPRDLAQIPGLPDDPARLRGLVCVAPTDDPHAARATARILLASYLNVPAYAAIQRLTARAGALTLCWERWSAGDRRGAAAAIPDEVVDELVVHGSPAECRARLAEWQAIGVRPIVILVGPAEHWARLERLGPRHSHDTWS